MPGTPNPEGFRGDELRISDTMAEPMAPVSDALLEQYRDISNATVLGQLLRRGYDKVYMLGVESLAPSRRLVGRAVTLQ